MAAQDSKRGWRFIDLTGQRFTRLVVVSASEPGSTGGVRWKCLCDCGNSISAPTSSLRTMNTRSCGCLASEEASARAAQRNLKHGLTIGGVPLWYQRWQAMMARCNDPKNKRFDRYGGRGIKVCDRWHDPANFYADMGEVPPGMTLDRIDNDGPYSPENCRWADAKTQARNKSTSRLVTHNGQTFTLQEWANRLGMNQATLHRRLARWGVARAIETPLLR